MMATTHVFAGLVLAALVALVAPQFALVVGLAAIVGGLVPDCDLYAGHRKTLHFPVYYWVVAVPASLAAVLAPSDATVALAVFFIAAGLHSVMDHFGGGLELKPWEGTSDRAVYSHYHDRWLRPRRWVPYDGSPGDLALASVLALPALVVFDGVVYTLAIGLLAVSIGYAVVRKPLVRGAEWLVERTPATVLAHLPDRFLPIEDDRGGTAD